MIKDWWLDAERQLIHLIKERRMLMKYYRFGKSEKAQSQLFISLFDNRRKSFGLTDRFKGIVSLYAFSKIFGASYRCSFTYPFDLQKFLMPNEYDWTLKEKDLSELADDVKIFILQGEKGNRLIRTKSQKQLHVYLNRDYLPLINQTYNTCFEWGPLFNELFKPSAILANRIDFHVKNIATEYVGCVFRFQSLLGDFKEYNFGTLEQKDRTELVDKCLQALVILKNREGKPLLVTSDSSSFIAEASRLDGVITIQGDVVHLDCDSTAADEVYMKSFVDFMVLANASRIYSIGTEIMYPSEFPLYAAKVRNIPFQRIVI